MTQGRLKGWKHWIQQLREPLVDCKLGSEWSDWAFGHSPWLTRAWRQGDQLPQSSR